MTNNTKQYADAFMYGNGQTVLITIQLASPKAHALFGDEADAHGCISLTEDAFVTAGERLDAAGLWLRPL